MSKARPVRSRCAIKGSEVSDPPPDLRAVELLAYRLWEERGRPDGSSDQDWRRAEELLRGERVLAEQE